MEDKDGHLVFYSPRKGQLILFCCVKTRVIYQYGSKELPWYFCGCLYFGSWVPDQNYLSTYFRAAYQWLQLQATLLASKHFPLQPLTCSGCLMSRPAHC